MGYKSNDIVIGYIALPVREFSINQSDFIDDKDERYKNIHTSILKIIDHQHISYEGIESIPNKLPIYLREYYMIEGRFEEKVSLDDQGSSINIIYGKKKGYEDIHYDKELSFNDLKNLGFHVGMGGGKYNAIANIELLGSILQQSDRRFSYSKIIQSIIGDKAGHQVGKYIVDQGYKDLPLLLQIKPVMNDITNNIQNNIVAIINEIDYLLISGDEPYRDSILENMYHTNKKLLFLPSSSILQQSYYDVYKRVLYRSTICSLNHHEFLRIHGKISSDIWDWGTIKQLVVDTIKDNDNQQPLILCITGEDRGAMIFMIQGTIIQDEKILPIIDPFENQQKNQQYIPDVYHPFMETIEKKINTKGQYIRNSIGCGDSFMSSLCIAYHIFQDDIQRGYTKSFFDHISAHAAALAACIYHSEYSNIKDIHSHSQ